MLDHIPQELFQQVLLPLGPADLKSLRLVNKEFSRNVVPALFQTIDISCLTLDRLHHIAHHPQISLVVEVLQYHEMSFSGTAIVPADYGPGRVQFFSRTMTDFIVQSNVSKSELTTDRGPWLREFLAEEWEVPGEDDDDGASCGVLPEPGEGELEVMIRSILDLYAEKAVLQKPRHLYEAFRDAFPRLRNLTRIVCVDAGAGGIGLDYSCFEDEVAFEQLRTYFPVTDTAVRNMFQVDVSAWPAHGFLGIWRALSDEEAHSKIKHLEIRRDEDLFSKHGVSLERLDSHDEAVIGGFRNLTTIILCIEVDRPSETGPAHESRLLSRALAGASKLKRLEISLTSGPYTAGLPLRNLLPLETLPELQTLVLEEVHFSLQDICSWLFLQPRLKNLGLRRPYLHGRWKDLVEKWSEESDFVLDSFELRSPWDHETRRFEEDEEEMKVAARVSNGLILDYINNGGVNPLRHRRWRNFNRELRDEQGDQDDDHLSDYSDISEWREEDHPTPIEDSDGPEFDEDYDFDAEEESDVEMEWAPTS